MAVFLAGFVGVGGAADAEPGALSLGLGVSTLGATVEAAYRINDSFGVRVPAGYLDASYSDTDDGLAQDHDLMVGGIGLLGDYYPGLGRLRLSGGAFVNGIDVDGRARGDGVVGDTFYSGVDLDVDGSARNAVMPALSLGLDADIGRRWMLSADLGALYTGGFDIAARDSSGQVSQADLDAEVRQRESDAPDFYPYLKFTVAFRF